MLSVFEVAEQFKVGRDTVLSWIRTGELEAIDAKPSGSKRAMYRVDPEAVERFQQSRRTKRVHNPAIEKNFKRFV